MKNNKNLIILSLLAIITITITTAGIAFAYYAFMVDGTGTTNPQEINVKTAELTNIVFEGEDSLDSTENIYPGWIGIQEFSLSVPEDTSPTAKGRFSISMTSTIDSEFGSDITYEIYKTTNEGDSISRTEGKLIPDSNKNLSRTDTITFSGTWEENHQPLKQGTLSTKTEEIEIIDVTGETSKTYYYVVFKYSKSEDDQTSAMGKHFTSKIEVAPKPISLQ